MLSIALPAPPAPVTSALVGKPQAETPSQAKLAAATAAYARAALVAALI